MLSKMFASNSDWFPTKWILGEVVNFIYDTDLCLNQIFKLSWQVLKMTLIADIKCLRISASTLCLDQLFTYNYNSGGRFSQSELSGNSFTHSMKLIHV